MSESRIGSRRRRLSRRVNAVCRMVGTSRGLPGNGIRELLQGRYQLIGAVELSDSERT